jgi:DNA-directed RNA polymerase specialized sigma24 family protein
MARKRINPAVLAAFRQPGWNETFARAVLHADTKIRKYIWRGFRPKAGSGREITVGDKSAADFVQESVAKLLDGTRRYDSSRTLLENLNSVADSLIWSAKKASDRAGVVDHADTKNADDPISQAEDPELTVAEKLKHSELLDDQKKCFKQIRASFDGDKPMQEYLDALASGIFKRAEISEVTGLNVDIISELRRKLAKYAPKFFGVKNFDEFQRLLYEGGA